MKVTESKFQIDEATRFQIQRELILMAAAAGWLTSGLLLIAFAVFAFTAYREGHHLGSLIIAAGGAGTITFRVLLRKYYRSNELRTKEQVDTAKRLIVFSAILSSVTWAFGAIWIYPKFSTPAGNEYLMLLVGSAAVGSTFMPNVGSSYRLWLAISIAPLIYASISTDVIYSIMTALLVVAFIVTMDIVANTNTRKTIALAERVAEIDAMRRERAELIAESADQAMRAAEMSEQAANDARDLFVAKVSHEFRTPLQAIISAVELLEERWTRDPRPWIEEPMRRLTWATEQLMGQAKDLARYVRAQSGQSESKPELVNLSELLTNAVEPSREQAVLKNLRFSIEVPNVNVYIDPVELRQIVVNLVGNAVKYTETGEVALVVEINGEPKRGNMVVRVIDSGVGIPADMQDKIFEPWFRCAEKKVEGLGLGLAIVKTLLSPLNGTIEVKSEVNKGTIMTVRIPLAPPPVLQAEEFKPNVDLKKLTVLVVDDTAAAREAVVSVLESRGIKCVEVSSGYEALNVAERQRFDAMLLDLQMPVMDGYQLCVHLRKFLRDRQKIDSAAPKTRIIAMSAYKSEPGRIAEFDEFVAKPATVNDLIRAITTGLPATQAA